MNKREFRVEFVTGQVEIVYALTAEEAAILAQARQIYKGNDYTVRSVTTGMEREK